MLDIKNISKTFNPGTVNEKRALTDLSLHLESGDFATIVGSNGAGKSTLFNAIAGCFYGRHRQHIACRTGHHIYTGASAQPRYRAAVSGPAPRHRAAHDDRRKSRARVSARLARKSLQPHIPRR